MTKDLTVAQKKQITLSIFNSKDVLSIACKKHGISVGTYYGWRNRYANGKSDLIRVNRRNLNQHWFDLSSRHRGCCD